ncbi:Transcriptional regulator, AraC family [Arcticibacter svalbardensis MN12-7]|uniref:Transcriptional regulator, AraC family n=1 Tax=Arcticibacter svalbardensis MN12-7 TaxID=1150600 RepID=R9GPL3_9SPHI|nr:AraC family transcriptional regulator [Arcticibacter svalbardensis]EOR93485.1 Transcriptional regulator, AraC family [Arcticibacter svalbardensis MN12-7]
MNPHLQKIPMDGGQSFSVQLEMGLKFNKQWHYHQEVEIIYIIHGSGTRCIGDSVDYFKEDQLFFIGSNVPHMLRPDQDYNPNYPDEVVVIHFQPELFNPFLSLPENKKIADLLNQASFGISIHSETLLSAKALIHSSMIARNTDRFIILLQLLNLIAGSQSNRIISHTAFGYSFHKSDDSRLNRIFHYTLANFSKEITLKEIAELVHLCPHSFCRYFKSRTRKRYSFFLLELRISHACKLLTESNLSIAIISYECGLMNFSNFNRHFKSVTGKTPLEYRKKFNAVKKTG